MLIPHSYNIVHLFHFIIAFLYNLILLQWPYQLVVCIYNWYLGYEQFTNAHQLVLLLWTPVRTKGRDYYPTSQMIPSFSLPFNVLSATTFHSQIGVPETLRNLDHLWPACNKHQGFRSKRRTEDILKRVKHRRCNLCFFYLRHGNYDRKAGIWSHGYFWCLIWIHSCRCWGMWMDRIRLCLACMPVGRRPVLQFMVPTGLEQIPYWTS